MSLILIAEIVLMHFLAAVLFGITFMCKFCICFILKSKIFRKKGYSGNHVVFVILVLLSCV